MRPYFKHIIALIFAFGIISCQNDDIILENNEPTNKSINSELLKVAAFGETLTVDEIIDNISRSANSNVSRSTKSFVITDSLSVAVSNKLSRGTSDSVMIYSVYDADRNVSLLCATTACTHSH